MDEVVENSIVEQAPEVAESTPAIEPVEMVKEQSLEEKIAAKSQELISKEPVSDPNAPLDTYKPNYKVKVLDKEHEIPKEFQGLMKDATSEKQVREIFEKAYGLDTVKPKYQELKTKYSEANGQVEHFTKSVQELQNIYTEASTTKNYLKLDDFFSKMNMEEDVILNWALAKVKLYEMPQEQRQLVEGKIQAERQANELSQKYDRTEQLIANQAAQMKMIQFESSLAKPDVKEFSEQFDASFGSAGAFKEKVKEVGQMAWHLEHKDLTPDQAIERVMKSYGNLVKSQVAAPTEEGTPAQVANPEQKVVVRNTTKTIPNISGKGNSPLKAKPRNIEDLKKLAQNF